MAEAHRISRSYCCVAGRLARLLLSVPLFAALCSCGHSQKADPTRPEDVSGFRVGPQHVAVSSSPNVVICVIDAARADHIGYHGYERETTPNLDRLAGESVVFEKHFAPYSQTKASTVSLLTGLYPDTHLTSGNHVMDESLFTIEKGLAAAGFQTVLLSSNPVASPEMGVGTDFDEAFATPEALEYPQDVVERGKENAWKVPEVLSGAFSCWLDGDRQGPFFAYLHFLPPHLPYGAPAEIQELFSGREPPAVSQGGYPFREVAIRAKGQEPPPLEEWVNLYDANLRWADHAVGSVVDFLRERGLLEKTLLIVTSDHGEAFGEHGYMYHGRGVYDELVHVPLLIRLPDRRRTGRISALTQTVDILPTVCELLEADYPRQQIEGRSLVPLIDSEAETIRDYAYATCMGSHSSYLVRSRTYALILYRGGVLRALYDLTTDPMQRRNIIDEEPEQAARMADEFRAFAASQRRAPLEFIDPKARPSAASAPPRIELSEEQRRELEALGYVD